MPKPTRTTFLLGLLYGALGIFAIPILLSKANKIFELPTITTPELQSLGMALILLGGSVLGIALTEYFLHEQTPLPTVEPTHLVTTGAYKYSRNPMFVGAAMIWLGQAFLNGSLLNYLFFITGCLLNHYHVVFEEEKYLKKTFGEKYTNYMKKTARYIPKMF